MVNFIGMLFFTPHYRLIHPSMNNITLVDIAEISNLGIFGIWGSLTEQATLTNFYITNTTTNILVADFRFMTQINCENFTFTNTSGIPKETISFISNVNITMKNIHIINYETASPTSSPIISFTGFPTSVIIIEQLYAKNVKLNSTPLFSVYTEPLKFILKDGKYNDIWIEEELTMFEFTRVGTFTISNHTFDNVNSIVSSDSSSKLININSLNTKNSTEAVISDIKITNSTISFLKINSISGSPTELKLMGISNIKYSDCSFPSFRSLITTFGIFGDINFELKLTNLIFKNINFEIGGELIHIQHLLPSPVQILSSIFQNVTAGRIKVKTFTRDINGIKTRVLFKD